MLSKIYVFISQVNHKKKMKVLPILDCLFLCSQNNRRLCKLVLSWLARWTRNNIPEKQDGKCHISSGWLRLSLDYLKQNKALQDGCHSAGTQQKSHNTKNEEDTKGTLQVLFLCTTKHVFFIVDISNKCTMLFWICALVLNRKST